MTKTQWSEVEEYVSAGNVMKVEMEQDLTTVKLEIVYGNNTSIREAQIDITCLGCSYIDIRRAWQHTEPGSAVIFEAYLHTSSSLIDDLRAYNLQAKTGALHIQGYQQAIKHLEIVGELNLNILCEEIEFASTGLPST